MAFMKPPLLAFPVALLLAGTADAASLEVIVTGVGDGPGTVRVGGYAGSDGFPEPEKKAFGVSLVAAGGTARAVVEDLKPGVYAVAVFHDENGNGVLDKGLFGIPKEGYGFSGDATGFMGPPDFADAAFTLDQAQATITIQLRY